MRQHACAIAAAAEKAAAEVTSEREEQPKSSMDIINDIMGGGGGGSGASGGASGLSKSASKWVLFVALARCRFLFKSFFSFLSIDCVDLIGSKRWSAKACVRARRR